MQWHIIAAVVNAHCLTNQCIIVVVDVAAVIFMSMLSSCQCCHMHCANAIVTMPVCFYHHWNNSICCGCCCCCYHHTNALVLLMLLLSWVMLVCCSVVLCFLAFFFENSTWELVWLVRDKSESRSFLKQCVWKEMSRLRKNACSFACKFSKRLLLNHCREDRRKFCIFAMLAGWILTLS